MITGELKSKIDRIWDAFWSGGISNPLEVIEQITYRARGTGPGCCAARCRRHLGPLGRQ